MKHIMDIETTGLNAMKDRITCVSILDLDENQPFTMYGEDEKQILKQFWIAIANSDTIITFNGGDFDIPFLIKRSLINNIPIRNNFSKIRHIDVRKMVNSFFYSYNKYEKGSLNDWAVILNGGKPKKTNGEEVINAYIKRDWKTIKKHCEDDVILTKKLYQRCIDCNLK